MKKIILLLSKIIDVVLVTVNSTVAITPSPSADGLSLDKDDV